jgi:hypothetical protein
MSNGIEKVCEMASKDSDWTIPFPVLPGPEEALPPVEPKITATRYLAKTLRYFIFFKFRYFSAIFWSFPNF